MNPQQNRFSRLESSAFYLLLVSVVLSPLAFWPSQYLALEAVKTIVISLLTMATLVIILVLAIREREFRLPPTSMIWIGILMTISIIASAVSSGHFIKSFFGQGFELGAGSFIITLILASLVTFMITVRKAERVIILYSGMVAAFLALWVFQLIRLVFGSGFASLGILNSPTATVLGSWFGLGIYAVVISIISLLAIKFLVLSKRMKIANWVLFALSALTVLVVNTGFIWQMTFLIFLGLTIYLSSQRNVTSGNLVASFFRRLEIVPLVICIIALVFTWKGTAIAGPLVAKINAGHAELSLPWTVTMDIASGSLKQSPLLGVGSNRFTQAYLTHKPVSMNLTDAWSVEFGSGFGFVPTFLVTNGFVGGILWVIFFIFFGIIGVKTLRGLAREGDTSLMVPEQLRPYARFVMISSYASASFLWLVSIIYVPSHVILYFAFVMTGIWLGTSVSYGRFVSTNLVRRSESRVSVLLPIFEALFILVFIFWGLNYIKNTVALAYFGSGVKQLNDVSSAENPLQADKKFEKAVYLNPIDIYWQARAEAGIATAKNMIATITSTTSAPTAESVARDASEIVNKSLDYANNAVSFDGDNYNNYVSQARVAEVATAMRMQGGYDSAVTAYTNAIRRNTRSPSLYLNLAKLQASQNQLDAAIQTIGAVLQIKNNYLDAIFLLSQVEAAKGNLSDAIVAAQFATELNPQNPLLFFQLGLLRYTNGSYTQAAEALTKALALEPNYSNAIYFLGLSDARLNKTEDAITAFQKLADSNPENTDISQILTTLRSGKSLFASPSVQAARPEKKSQLPLPVK